MKKKIRYIEEIYTDKYRSLYQAVNGSIQLMMGNCNTILSAQQILELNISTFDLIDYDHDKFLEFYKLGDSNVKN